MNIIRTLLLAVLGLGALAFATPSQARDLERVYINGRTYYSDRHHHHHHYDRDWQRDHRDRVIIRNDGGVSVAFGGHSRPYYHTHRHYYRDWDR